MEPVAGVACSAASAAMKGTTMATGEWTYQDLVKKLMEFEAELRDAGLKEG